MRIGIALLWIAGAAFGSALAPGAVAANLFTLVPAAAQKRAAQSGAGMHPIELDGPLPAIAAGESVDIPLPDGTSREVIHDRTFKHPNGDLTWVGYLAREGRKYRVFVTAGAGTTVGRILTPEAEYAITTSGGATWLVDHAAAGVRTLIADGDDMLVPPPLPAASSAANTVPEKAGGPSTIDVLVLYSTAFAAANGGDAGALTRINNKIAISNQAYIDSQVAQQLRLVGTHAVTYPDSTPIDQTLHELSGIQAARPAAFAQVPAWRNQVGADLVSLVRTFNGDTAASDARTGICGLAWAGGANLTNIANSSESAYSVVNDGRYGNSFCDDYTFAHELGHNMGSVHDRATILSQGGSLTFGAYPYSFGYGVSGSFTTIMGYRGSFANAPRVGRFSNPDIQCGSNACGQPPENTAAAADNALSLNNTRATVANFRATVVADPAASITEYYNALLNHYFMTADAAEKLSVESGGAGPGWQATGQSFKAGGNGPVCRFYGNRSINPATGQPYGPNSHFYTIDPAECAAVKRDPGWVFESAQVFNLTPPAAPGACPAGTSRIYRVYNNRAAFNDSNHRYMSDINVYNQMVSQGWSAEGVVFCATP